jgi:hypothetical protein
MPSADKTMFEIFREGEWNRRYYAIFYTDLDEHHRDKEIARAAAGETVFTGFLRDDTKSQARAEIEEIVQELNALDEGEAPSGAAIHGRLAKFLAAETN